MPERNQGQNRGDQKDRLTNPGTFSPDDDEAQEADRTPADAGGQGTSRQRQAAEQPIADIDEGDEDELDDDEDDADDIGAGQGA